MTILEKIKFEEDWLSEVNLTKENVKIAFDGIRATALEQQQQPCEDCISRAEALKAIEKEKQGWEGSERYAIDECHSRIAELPSVTPQPKVGRWIDSNLPQEKYVCSECGGACWYYDYEGSVAKSKYCPNCGVKMEVEDENKTK